MSGSKNKGLQGREGQSLVLEATAQLRSQQMAEITELFKDYTVFRETPINGHKNERVKLIVPESAGEVQWVRDILVYLVIHGILAHSYTW